MYAYNNLKARMRGKAPPNWSPALKPKNADIPVARQFGSGLTEASAQPSIDLDPPSVNQTMFQSYEWYTPSWNTPVTVSNTTLSNPVGESTTSVPTANKTSFDWNLPSHYSVITALLPSLASLGVTSMWLPPGCKASNPRDNGYGIYDLYDLGEFDCKGSRGTKWGTKEELIRLGQQAEISGVALLWDAVLNHRAAADRKQKAKAVTVNRKDRTIQTKSAHDIETWSCFDYSARNGKYSSMTYNWRHFSGIDWDDITRTKAIYKYVGDDRTTKPGWATDVDEELGNYDYLMFADLDYSQTDVQSDVLNWATWLPTQIPGLKGMRLDAIKHYSASFQYKLIKHLRVNDLTRDWFFVGEYWRAESKYLAEYIDAFAGHMHLFDVKLVYNFSDFSAGRITDLRTILQGSLVELKPHQAVTFVANHDTQATQSLPAPVSPWFQPHAYAIILLRSAGLPCIFYGDVFGTLGPQPTPPACGHRLMRLSLARTLYAYGAQHDFFVSKDCIAWSREGHKAHSGGAGLAVILNVAWTWCRVKIHVGRQHAGEVYTDLMGWSWDEVVIDSRGWGVFHVAPRTIGVFTDSKAVGREKIDKLIWPPIPGDGDGDEDMPVNNGV